MMEQARQLEFVHTSQFTAPVAEDYARELLDFAGENFRGGAVYFTCGGSESVETALKLVRQYQVEIGSSKLALFTYGNPERPLAVGRVRGGKGEIYWYSGYGQVPFDAKLFAKPEGTKIEEMKP